ncbi:MAG: hypothetical protein AMJ69_09225 [Gammaproteobacteria bacterium SG8_47]|nr:MAG: hypothetical protein AMJ69_09225 [Gammaproteobacteria bacterium SG8_47]
MAINIPGINSSKTHSTSDRTVQNLRDAGQQKSADKAAGGSGDDRVSLTATAALLKSLEDQLAAQPVVDEARVEGVRSALADGSYHIDADRVAEKLVEFERTLNEQE